MEQNLMLSADNQNDLLETTKWAKLMAIVGFVMCGILVLVGLSMSSIMSLMPNGEALGALGSSYFVGMAFFYVVIAALYFFPCLYLFKFAKSTKMALLNNNSLDLDLGLMNLRKMFKFVGVMTLVVLVLYGIIFVFAIAGVGMAAMAV